MDEFRVRVNESVPIRFQFRTRLAIETETKVLINYQREPTFGLKPYYFQLEPSKNRRFEYPFATINMI